MPQILLITGGTGNLGSHLVRIALKSGKWDEVHSTYHALNPNFHKIFWHFTDARNSILPMLTRINPTCIIHTMALSSPDECEKRKLDAWQINVKATGEIITYANLNAVRFVYTSTDLVFDGEKGDYSEEDKTCPVNFYGDTKLEVENDILEKFTTANYVTARLGLLYGFNLNQRLNFFDTLYNGLRNQDSVTLFKDQFRSMMNISNAAECLMELASNTYQGMIHLAGPERISRYDFGLRLAHHLKLPDAAIVGIKTEEMQSLSKRPKDVSMNISLALKTLKTPIQSVDEGIRSIFCL
ncbi:SDR family oxidoreductase [bacterium]|nr:MAG: SDR family oxidoreductase [bacterium]